MNKNNLKLPFQHPLKTTLQIYWLRIKLILLIAFCSLLLITIYLSTRFMLLKILPELQINYYGLIINRQNIIDILFPVFFIIVIILSTISVIREVQQS